MTRRQRAGTVLRGLAAVVLLGSFDLAAFLVWGKGIPCWFHRLTGLKCPGCGMTHALAHLCAGQVREAFGSNALCITVVPVTCLYLIYRAVRYVNGDGDGFHGWEYALLLLLAVAAAGYGIARNIPTVQGLLQRE